MTVPFTAIDTIFLDAGNTLISIDFELVASALQARGIICSCGELERAECAARPRLVRDLTADEGAMVPFQRYTLGLFNHSATLGGLDLAARRALAIEIADSLRARGGADRIWRRVMPGVPHALRRLRALGLRLVVVSNSDGTVAKSLDAAGLRPYFDAVIDSSVVGYEKPDPRIFLEALKESGARAENTLHVGDLYHVDVAGARSAGVHALLLDPFGDWPDVDCLRLPDLTVVAQEIETARPR